MGIESPEIKWQGNSPYSLKFKDIYYSTDNGLAETKHVFIEGNGLIGRFQNANKDSLKEDLSKKDLKKSVFSIFETGFGAGLNFCVAAKTFLENSSGHQYLNYISVEKYPLPKKDISKALEAFGEIGEFARELTASYPVRMSGIHRIFPFKRSNIILTLIFEDLLHALNQAYLTGPVDAWFLDGFSPAQNDEMWSDEVFKRMAAFSGEGTSLSTFTAAGHVRRKLESRGFKVVKAPGFGGKREMITASFSGKSPIAGDLQSASDDAVKPEYNLSGKPWYYVRSKKMQTQKVAIVGAGLSGCALADAFSKRNWQVDLIDKNEEICAEASGNPLGIFFPVIHRKPTFTSRFSGLSYMYLIRHLKGLADEGLGGLLHLKQDGLLQVIENAREIDRFTGFYGTDPDRNSGKNPGKNCLDEFYEFLDCETVENRFGVKSEGGVFFKDAGSISPKGLCEANLARHEKDNPVNILFSCTVGYYRRENSLWTVYDRQNNVVSKADVLVLANSWAMSEDPDLSWLKLQKIRGQLVNPELRLTGFDIPVSAETYMIPAADGVIVGATHDRFDDPDVRWEQSYELIEKTRRYMPGLEKPVRELLSKTALRKNIQNMRSRVSFRSVAADHFPVVGRLPNAPAYNEAFADLINGETSYFRKNGYGERPQAWHENLYCLTGCGSRGILYSQLGAEIIASMANLQNGEIVPVEKDILEALSPARFLFRALKKKTA